MKTKNSIIFLDINGEWQSSTGSIQRIHQQFNFVVMTSDDGKIQNGIIKSNKLVLIQGRELISGTIDFNTKKIELPDAEILTFFESSNVFLEPQLER